MLLLKLLLVVFNVFVICPLIIEFYWFFSFYYFSANFIIYFFFNGLIAF